MANPATFNQPTVPITLNLPINQLPQPVTPAPQQQQIQQPEQPKPEKLPAALHYIFPWKNSK